jgi:hypothetical protein
LVYVAELVVEERYKIECGCEEEVGLGFCDAEASDVGFGKAVRSE